VSEREELPEDDDRFRPPLPPDDRIWRHPSELGPVGPPTGELTAAPPRSRVTRRAVVLVAGTAAAVLLVGIVLTMRSTQPPATVASDTGITTLGSTIVGISASPGGTAAPVREPVRRALVRVVATTAHGPVASTGVVIDDHGTILTAIEATRGARAITVELSDGRSAPAELLDTDPSSGLAVLSTTAPALMGAPVVEMALPTSGTAIKVVGTAAGTTLAKLASGTVEALGEKVELADGTAAQHQVRIDAPKAGDALGNGITDSQGRLIAVVTAVKGGDLYATPIGIGAAVAASVHENGKVKVPWLGIEGSNADPGSAKRAGVQGGALVVTRADESPAITCGLAEGDVITGIDGQPTTSMAAVATLVRSRQVGDTITITYSHDGKPDSTAVRLAEAAAADR
jgi:putative serine protease PepD